MLRMVAAELAQRRGRALAMLAGIAVATASFTVLTGTSESSRLAVRGQVNEHFRTAYDLLVRSRRSVQELERRGALVQQNFLTGTYGGITMEQYREVRRTPGVEVAAPLAIYGYVMPDAEIPIPLADHLSPGTRSAFRVRQDWTADRGTVRVRDPDSYVYVTRRPLLDALPGAPGERVRARASEAFSRDLRTNVCPGARVTSSPHSEAARSWLWCWSTRSGLAFGDFIDRRVLPELGARIHFPFPLLVAGIDPEAEAQLSGADRAVVSGRWFEDGEGPRKGPAGTAWEAAPMLIAASTDVDLRDEVAVEKLPDATAERYARAGNDLAAARRALRDARGVPLVRRTITARDAYAQLLRDLRAGSRASVTVGSPAPSRTANVETLVDVAVAPRRNRPR